MRIYYNHTRQAHCSACKRRTGQQAFLADDDTTQYNCDACGKDVQ